MLAGRGELGDLVADGLADARDLRRLAGPIGGHEVDRAAPDGIGGAVVGDGLEHELALDLEHVADLVEDPGQVAVGQRRAVGPSLGGWSVAWSADAGRVVGSGRDDPVAAGALGPIQRPVGESRPAPRSGSSASPATATPDRHADARHAVPRAGPGRDGRPDALADLERDAGPGLRSRTTNSSPPNRAGTSSSRTAADDRAGDRPQDLVADRMAVACR